MAITAWAAKCLDKLDLLVGERVDALRDNDEDADQVAFAQQWNAQSGAKAAALRASSQVNSGSANTSGM